MDFSRPVRQTEVIKLAWIGLVGGSKVLSLSPLTEDCEQRKRRSNAFGRDLVALR